MKEHMHGLVVLVLAIHLYCIYTNSVHTTVGALPPMASIDPGCHGRCILDIPLKIAQEKYKNGIDIQYTTDMG